MASAVRRLGSLSMARGCARIDAGPDTAKIGSADRVQVHHARLIAVIGVRKTYPHGLDPLRTLGRQGVAQSGHWIPLKEGVGWLFDWSATFNPRPDTTPRGWDRPH